MYKMGVNPVEKRKAWQGAGRASSIGGRWEACNHLKHGGRRPLLAGDM